MAAQRIYVVTIDGRVRLVRAAHPSTALMHVAREVASVAVASQEALVKHIAAGVPVESIKAEQQELPEV